MTTRIAFVIPMQLPSVANLREHWRPRSSRTKGQRARAKEVMVTLLHAAPEMLACKSWEVELTRIAPRELDSDNLQSALKAVRDGIADALPVKDDRDPKAGWEYGQKKGLPGESALRVEVRGQE